MTAASTTSKPANGGIQLHRQRDVPLGMELLRAVGSIVALKALLMLATTLAIGFAAPHLNPLAHRWDDQAFRQHGLLGDALRGGRRWDAVWYLRAAHDGYTGLVKEAAFFPLLPALTALIAVVTRSYLVAATVVSMIACVAAVLLFPRVARHIGAADHEIGQRATWLWLLFPAAVVLTTPYPEALVVTCTLATWLLTMRGRYAWAGVVCGCALLAKPLGIVALPLLFSVSSRAAISGPPRGLVPIKQWRRWRAVAIAAALAAIWPIFLAIRFGDPLRFVRAQSSWSRGDDGFFGGIADIFTAFGHSVAVLVHQPLRINPAVIANLGDPVGIALQNIVDTGAIAFLIVCCVLAWRWFGRAPAIALIVLTAMPIAATSSDIPLLSAPRIVLVAAPAFLCLGRLVGTAAWWRSTLVASSCCFGFMAAGLATWQWLG